MNIHKEKLIELADKFANCNSSDGNDVCNQRKSEARKDFHTYLDVVIKELNDDYFEWKREKQVRLDIAKLNSKIDDSIANYHNDQNFTAELTDLADKAIIRLSLSLPRVDTDEVASILEETNKEYNYPANTANNRRLGWEAARRYLNKKMDFYFKDSK